MKKNLTQITVFISCPDEVERERKIVQDVCVSLSKSLVKRRLEVKSFYWKDNIIFEIYGKGAQKQINNKLNKIDYDIYIGILWKYFGYKQANGYTPTEEEFENALKRLKENGRPQIKFLFKQNGIKKSPKEFKNVIKFQSRVREEGLVDQFSSTEEFQRKIFEFINKIIVNLDYLPKLKRNLITDEKFEKKYIKRKVANYATYHSTSFEYFRDENLEDFEKVIKIKQRIILLSNAGIGKSTELKNIQIQFSKKDSHLFPLPINLNKFTNNALTSLFPDYWKEIPTNQLLLLMDGLDEVESKFRNNLIREIESFSEKYHESKMLISSRTNFYNAENKEKNKTGTLKDFETYVLTNLTYEQYKKYIKENLVMNIDEFWKTINLNKIYDLLRIPFYLINLVKIFNASESIPKTRDEIYDRIIRSRIDFDTNHYRLKFGDEKIIDKNFILGKLGRVALTMEILGRNYLSNIEYKKVEPNSEIRKLLQHKSLFNKKDFNWEFEHNSIQEYLAAKHLYEFDLVTIKSLLAFKPNYEKVIPSWTNTLSFLLNIYPNDLIKDWILSIEPELAIQFEQDRISEFKRISIFKSIFNDYKNKQIWIDRNKYRYLELARFAQSNEGIIFLLQFIDRRRHFTTIGNAINLIGNMRIPPHLENQVKSKLLKIAKAFNHPAIQNDAILALASLKYYSKKLIDKLIDDLGDSDNDWIRYGLYSIINQSNKQNNYVNVYLDGLKYTKQKFENPNTGEGRLINESMELNDGLSKITEADSVRSIINYFITNTDDLNIIGFDRITEQLWLNAVLAYEQDNSIHDLIIDLLFQMRKHYLREEATKLRVFFETTKTYRDAFLKTFKQNKISDDFPYKWSFFVAPECFDIIYKKYENSELSDDIIWELINSLNYDGNPFIDDFRNFINEKTNNKFHQKLITRDFEQERKETKERELKLLFNRGVLFEEIETIFKLERKKELSKSEIDEIKKRSWEDNKYLNSVLSILNNQTEVEPITISKSKKKIGIKSWNYWSINKVYNLMHHDSNYKPTESHIACVKEMCNNWVKKIDFNNAIEQKGQTYTTNDRAILSSYFLKNFNFKYPQKVLLDLVSYDWENTGILYLVNFLSVDQIKKRIIYNISNKKLNDREIRNYLDFSKQYRLEEIKNFAISVLLNKEKDSELREFALEVIDSSKTIEGILSKFIKTDKFRWDVIDWLIGRNSNTIENFLLEELDDDKSTTKVQSAFRLVQIGNSEGLKYYTLHLESSKRFVLDRYGNNPFKDLSDIKVIPYLFRLLKLSYSDDLKQDRYDTLYSTVISVLTQIALTNEANYILIRNELIAFIEKHKGSIKKINFLYSYIDSLEQQFYFNKSEKYTIDEVVEILNQIET